MGFGPKPIRCNVCSSKHTDKLQAYRARKFRLSKLGITPEEYDLRLEKQEGRCAICLCLPRARSLAVDHDHSTGQLRDLLCTSCNLALGQVHDDVEILGRMINYLESWRRNG